MTPEDIAAVCSLVEAAESIEADLIGNADSRVRGQFIMLEMRRVELLLNALQRPSLRTLLRRLSEESRPEDTSAASSSEAKPMELVVDLDWATRTCPCGASICSRHESDAAWEQFVDDHYDHSDGTEIEHCSDDGARVFSERPADRRRELRRPQPPMEDADA